MKTCHINKRILKFSTLVMLLLFISCGEKKVDVDTLIEEGDLKALKSEYENLNNQNTELQSNLAKLEKAIAKLDTTKGGYTIVKYQALVDEVFKNYVELQGNIETKKDVQISPEFSGVMNLRVSEGQYVGRGTLLATISDGGVRDQLNQAQIQVQVAQSQLKQSQIQEDLAKTTFLKQQSLWNQEIGSEMQYLQAKTNYETAQKQVQISRQQIASAQKGVANINAQLQKTRLYAPFSGVVEQVITKSGQVVAPGIPIIRLVNTGNLKVVANVPEKYLETIKKGTEVTVEIPSTGKKIESRVSLVSASVNPSNRTFKVEVPVSSEGGTIKPNLNAKVFLNNYTNSEAIVIPEHVIQTSKGGQYVFTVKNIDNKGFGKAHKVIVQTGEASNGKIEILAGLQANDKLILESQKLKEGSRVKIYKGE